MSSPRAGRQIANLRPPLGFQPTIPDSAANPSKPHFMTDMSQCYLYWDAVGGP
jgi:hypothetical protein